MVEEDPRLIAEGRLASKSQGPPRGNALMHIHGPNHVSRAQPRRRSARARSSAKDARDSTRRAGLLHQTPGAGHSGDESDEAGLRRLT